MLDLARLSPMRYLALFSGVYAAMFLVRLAFGVLTITFGHYVTGDNFVLGLVVAAAPLLELVTVLLASLFVDRYGRKLVLLAGLALASIALYLLALTENVAILALVNGLHGVASALILVTTLAIIASYAPPDRRGREMGLFNFVNIFGWFAGFSLGTILTEIFAPDRIQYTFVIAGGLATVGLVYGYFAIHEPPRDPRQPREKTPAFAVFRVFAKPGVLFLAGGWFLVYVFIGSMLAFFSRVASGSSGLGFAGGSVALGLLGFGAFFMLSQLVFGKLADKYGREPFMILGAACFLGFLATIALGVFGASAQEDPRLVFEAAVRYPILLAFLSFGALAFAPAALAALADEAPEATEGATMSVYSIVLNLGFIVGPPVVGLASVMGGGRGVMLFFVLIGLALLGIVLARAAYVAREHGTFKAFLDSVRPSLHVFKR